LGIKVIFHIDFDYFFAQCEEIRTPNLRTKPVCVCVFSDRGGDSGAIATANYIAREFGIKSGMSISLAKKKLDIRDDAVFLPVDFDYYIEMSEKAMNIIRETADIFEYVGKDEAYLDVTNRVKENFDKASHLAQQIKNSLRDKLKLSCSIGVSSNKLISKIASDFNKPDGLTIITPEKVVEFLEPLKIRTIPGIGNKTEERLTQMNLKTIKDLKKLDVFTLNKEFGRKNGTYIFNAIRGIDNELVKERESTIQYSKLVTLKKDSDEYKFLAENLNQLCKELHQIIRRNNRMFKLIGIQFILSDLSNKTKSKTLKSHTASFDELQKNADQLLKEALKDQKITVRRLGVKVSDLLEIHGQNDITSYF
jgi:DNA polymerase IV (archaeal DinB-like DNA polymerase)